VNTDVHSALLCHTVNCHKFGKAIDNVLQYRRSTPDTGRKHSTHLRVQTHSILIVTKVGPRAVYLGIELHELQIDLSPVRSPSSA
jgi:hypothetical protein